MTKPEFAIDYLHLPDKNYFEALLYKKKPEPTICFIHISIPPGGTTPEELSEAISDSDLKKKMIGYNIVLEGKRPRRTTKQSIKWVYETLRDLAEQSAWIAIRDPETKIATVVRSRTPEKEVGDTFEFKMCGED